MSILGRSLFCCLRVAAVLSYSLAPAPSVTAQTSAADVVLRPGRVATVAGGWTVVGRSVGGRRRRGPPSERWRRQADAAARAPRALLRAVVRRPKANVPYRLWMRGRAQGDSWANDSVFVQFTSRSTAPARRRSRIGTTSALEVNLEDCSGCGLSGWGWQDNGWGVGVLGPEVIFAAVGHPADARADARGRLDHRSDRAVAAAVSDDGPRLRSRTTPRSFRRTASRR